MINNYSIVPGINPPVPEEVKEEEPESKIVVTIHDINSPKSSNNDLQGLNENQ